MAEAPTSAKLIIDHRGTEKNVVFIGTGVPERAKKKAPENPLAEKTASLSNKLNALREYYATPDATNDTDEETGLRYLGKIQDHTNRFTSQLEKTGTIKPEAFESVLPDLDKNIEDVEGYSKGKNTLYLESLKGLRDVLLEVKSNRFLKGMYGFTESSLSQINGTLSEQKHTLEKLIAQRQVVNTKPAKHDSALDAGEIDFEKAKVDTTAPVSLDDLFR